MSTNILDAVLAQYEKSTQTFSPKMSQEERMKKYFTALLKENEKEATRRVRILPTTDGTSPFKEAYFHEIQVNGKWQKFYDPAQNDNEESPLTDVYDELIATGKESDKELAKQYKARKFYIIKLIDRDAEQDGPKFWRFKHNYKKEGIFDKIMPIFRQKGDVTDPDKGRDLLVSLVKSTTPQKKTYTAIQSIMYDDPTTLSSNKEQASAWINDELSWSDVYSKKPKEYLEAIARGETPRWDNNAGKYVYGDNVTDSTTMGGGKTYDEPDMSGEDEDLPF
jgi:hypothetical protein